MNQHTDPACQILKKFEIRLIQVSLPMELVDLLHKEGLICKQVSDELKNNGGYLTNYALRSLYSSVYKDCSNLKILASILSRSAGTISLATAITDDYSK